MFRIALDEIVAKKISRKKRKTSKITHIAIVAQVE
jgi:hypothetical protein